MEPLPFCRHSWISAILPISSFFHRRWTAVEVGEDTRMVTQAWTLYCEPVKALSSALQLIPSLTCRARLPPTASQPCISPPRASRETETGKVYNHCLPQRDNWVLPHISSKSGTLWKSHYQGLKIHIPWQLSSTRQGCFMVSLSDYTNTLWVAGAMCQLSSSFFSQLLGHF